MPETRKLLVRRCSAVVGESSTLTFLFIRTPRQEGYAVGQTPRWSNEAMEPSGESDAEEWMTAATKALHAAHEQKENLELHVASLQKQLESERYAFEPRVLVANSNP